MKRLKLGLIGAGARGGQSYAPYALKFPGEVCFTCVAEPIKKRREDFAKAHQISPEMQFDTWEDMLAAKPELDGLIIANQDRQHFEPTMQALEQGYHILLEKPMAESEEKTTQMVQKAVEKNRLLMVCHVLRYTPFFEKIKEVVDSGLIGDVQTIHHLENIGNWHFAHSFVRGNWRNAEESTTMILQKCSHDMDILNFIIDKPCVRLSSFGSLSYFTKKNMPKGATKTCGDCPHNKTCAFTAYNYLVDRPEFTPFRDIIYQTDDADEFLHFLEQSPYFRCVYQCDNDVADHQTVQLEYEGGVTVTFNASAFSCGVSRQTKIMGTKGEIEGMIEDDCFYHRDFNSGNETKYNLCVPKTLHSGGDEKIMAHFISGLRDPEEALKNYSAEFSLAGHIMAFKAEESRLANGKVIEL